MRTSRVELIFVGETEWRSPALKNDYWHIYVLSHKVGEIDHSAWCKTYSIKVERIFLLSALTKLGVVLLVK